MNAVELAKKKISKIKIVISGAGASAVACATHYLRFGVKLENIIMCDTKGVLFKGRTEGMNKYKEKFAVDTKLRTLEEAMVGSDVFVGLSKAGLSHTSDGEIDGEKSNYICNGQSES